MRNIWILSWANIRRNIGHTVSLIIFMIIAASLLNIGSVVLSGVDRLFDKHANANHAAHFTGVYLKGSDTIEQGLKFIKNYPKTTESETIDAVGGMGNYLMNDIEGIGFIILSRIDKNQKMDAPSLVGKYIDLHGDSIYIPYFMLVSGGFKIGDEFTLTLSGRKLKFTVAGSTEEIMFGGQYNTYYRFYISDEKYNELEKQLPDNGITLLSARLETNEDAVFFEAYYNKEVSTDGLSVVFTYDAAKTARTSIPEIAAVIVTTFAIILLIVSLIVIRFRIINSIEENMINIGTQKAVGYKSAQIISSIILQFGVITLIGGTAGITLAQAAIPVIMKGLEPMTALVWDLGFDIMMAVVSILTVMATVVFISYISAHRINKLHPLTALRGGITNHSFKKNTVPLDKTYGPINFLLALKQLLQNKGQAVTVSIIVAAVTMVSVAGISVNYNMNEKRDNFASTFLGEIPDVNIMLKSNGSDESFKKRILERSEVRKAFGYETGVTILTDETSIAATIIEDCSLLESDMIIGGRYPKHNNEVALGPAILKVIRKKIGDTVILKSGEQKKEFLITGIVQFINQGGFNGIITGDGFREIQSDFKFTGYNVYLNDGVDTKEFIKSAEISETTVDPNDYMFDNIMDVKDGLKSTMDSMSGIFASVAAGIVAVTAFVVILILYIVIKINILKRKRELGIQKALGFTTIQLMNQIALNISPVILAGVIIGSVTGFCGFNPMIVLVMSGMGIVKAQLPAPLDQTIIICIALVILAYIVSIAISWRIRKISAYSMIIEE